MNKTAIIEVLKSAGRFLWFGFLSLVVVVLTSIASDGAITEASVVIGGQQVQVGFLLVALIGTVIKALDRYIHVNKNISINGLAPSVLQK